MQLLKLFLKSIAEVKTNSFSITSNDNTYKNETPN
ncbi:hypothetical protein SAMN05421813_103121 [Daejeonella rubra]|uniref:Uncharacterized protein n=1 Tax=Daejeonella rubra TaxID=990371 RepID=A0A1G9NPR3_9SPHI|nr:hypothetical protein SAMN05421813_103121 [Daejeonella rubra]